jgi:putative spermidine/putrescine transport system permease protein
MLPTVLTQNLWPHRFRRCTVIVVNGAMLAGALPAFALSSDEIIVTTSTAGPGLRTQRMWIS